MADEVLVEFADRIALITINPPAARNAVNPAVALSPGTWTQSSHGVES